MVAAEEEVRAIVLAAPEFVAAHPMDAHAPDEDIMLLEHSFFSTNSEAYVDVPGFATWQGGQDQSPGYRHHQRLLKLVQWQKRQRGESGRCWVLKTPHHLAYLDLLFGAYPDARVVQTHRDPVQTIPSLASLVHIVRTTGSDTVDPTRTGRQWSARMRRWAAENARDRRPEHRYTPGEFGLSEEGIARDFARYRRRFITRAAGSSSAPPGRCGRRRRCCGIPCPGSRPR